MTCPHDGFAVLTSLGRLACLVPIENSCLPACLPRLTGLEDLCLSEATIESDPDEAAAAVNEALQQLTGVSMCGLVLQQPYCSSIAEFTLRPVCRAAQPSPDGPHPFLPLLHAAHLSVHH